MKIELILTFEEGQKVAEFELSKSEIMDIIVDKEKFIYSLLAELPKDKFDSSTLVKISCCIYKEEGNIALPDWYYDCNGKFWFENGQLTD